MRRCDGSARRSLLLAMCALPLLGFGRCLPDPSPEGPPDSGRGPYDIVLIIADDLSYDHYGFAGHPVVRTPSIDALAQQSVHFPNAYVPSFCRPTLATLLTGLPQHVHGVTYIAGDQLGDFATIADRLGDAGYETYQAGKFWEGGPGTRGFSDHAPFTHFTGNLEIGRTPIDPIFDFIDQAESPWFVWFSPLMPHTPHDAPDEYRALYADAGLDDATLEYYAMISWFDDVVGELVAGLDDDTVVVFLSDNGFLTSAEPNKYTSDEHGIRTQLLIRHPERPGEVRSLLVDAVDVTATILALAGAEHADLPGQDLLAHPWHQSVFGTVYAPVGANGLLLERWVRTGDWKLVDSEAGEDALYHLESDPDEQHDLIGIRLLGWIERLLRLQIERWWS